MSRLLFAVWTIVTSYSIFIIAPIIATLHLYSPFHMQVSIGAYASSWVIFIGGIYIAGKETFKMIVGHAKNKLLRWK